ncbi:MAG: DegV family EDD domain-containing protein, partial [Clostridia bacterium]|nr:DegV family EDD domain-containing protein [Clostridia bacterium]
MIKILTDTSCDLSYKQAEALDIEILPITVSFGQEVYTPLEDLSNEEFYEKLSKAETLPKTAQVTPAKFEEEFTRHIENGDEVIGLFISKELSGTYNNAVMAKN